MTRNEFDDIRSWSELLDVCSDYECDYCRDICDRYEMEDDIQEQVNDWDGEWDILRDFLNSQPSYDEMRSFPYFKRNCDGVFETVSDGDYEFDEYKDDIREWMEDHGYLDDDFESALVTFRRFEPESPESASVASEKFEALFV